eukprot:6648583-Prymnesium_polylepis.1
MGSTHRVFGYRRVEHRNARWGVGRPPYAHGGRQPSGRRLSAFLTGEYQNSETCPSSKVYPNLNLRAPQYRDA